MFLISEKSEARVLKKVVLKKKALHEKGNRELLNAIMKGNLHDELRKLIPVKINGLKKNEASSKTCFLKTILGTVFLAPWCQQGTNLVPNTDPK